MRALVCDDAQVQRRFFSLVMGEFRTLTLDEAYDVTSACALLDKTPYNIILLDINLPGGGTGFDILEHIHGRENHLNAETPVLMVSSQADEATLARAQRMGVRKFLSKPVPAVRIRDAVREILTLPDAAHPPGAVEKRRVPRLNIPVEVHFDGATVVKAITGDISPFGAFILSSEAQPVGSHATITVALPHLQESITVRCKVVHVREHGVGNLPQGFGVRFATEKPEDLARLVRAFTTPE